MVLAAFTPQAAASGLGGAFVFGLMFLSGLWTPPQLVAGPLATIIYYSPSGAAVRALLDSVFNQLPPYTTLVMLHGNFLIHSDPLLPVGMIWKSSSPCTCNCEYPETLTFLIFPLVN